MLNTVSSCSPPQLYSLEAGNKTAVRTKELRIGTLEGKGADCLLENRPGKGSQGLGERETDCIHQIMLHWAMQPGYDFLQSLDADFPTR